MKKSDCSIVPTSAQLANHHMKLMWRSGFVCFVSFVLEIFGPSPAFLTLVGMYRPTFQRCLTIWRALLKNNTGSCSPAFSKSHLKLVFHLLSERRGYKSQLYTHSSSVMRVSVAYVDHGWQDIKLVSVSSLSLCPWVDLPAWPAATSSGEEGWHMLSYSSQPPHLSPSPFI